ncbi:hypothetical protein SeMB42_g00501 [Synchytrium endobioticum]|uniref:SAP domain-containing protein n=1 Tax=Synchytrium endobioticum TaxID=286115 RepID=A0A507DRT6_9FUNG|nr:hypothetical protein SeLEV6574_g00071 [Synchytrium endobioticum]TPX53962.1 hypothetical protein SeMB42_g00501 [Synchytrium endobioticum]
MPMKGDDNCPPVVQTLNHVNVVADCSFVDYDQAEELNDAGDDQISYAATTKLSSDVHHISDTTQTRDINHQHSDDDNDDTEHSKSNTPVMDKLRNELESMGLSTKGYKIELKARLKKAKKRTKKPTTVSPNVMYETGRLRVISHSVHGADNTWKQFEVSGRDWNTARNESYEETDEVNACFERTQPYDFYCVLDVEATCDEGSDKSYPHEIIELPVILIDGQRGVIVDEFHSYVRPVYTPKLSSFCTNLTGITQDKVDASSPFPIVVGMLDQWLAERCGRYPFPRVLFITDGPWDLRDFVRKQCELSYIDRPPYWVRFLDLRRAFTDFYPHPRSSLSGMLNCLGMNFEGREHSGIDDARNIARIVLRMMGDGMKVKENVELKLSKRKVGRHNRVHWTKSSNENEGWIENNYIVI